MAKHHQKQNIMLPDGGQIQGKEVILHSCCAPCSAAIVEWMLKNDMVPTVFFSNSNIYPRAEYDKRREELIRFLKEQHVAYVEDEYKHEEWLQYVKGLENEPERGKRCSRCFEYRLKRAVQWAKEHHCELITTTLASSRWKNIDQINEAGKRATDNVPEVTFWEQNWRKGGLQERRGELLRLNNFYNQQYCGCEFSFTARFVLAEEG